MAEENNSEDLSMEDILSSIKNILSEDGAVTPDANDKPKETPAPAAAVAPEPSESEAIAEVEAEIIEDDEPEEEILDLSPEMRVEDEAEISLDEIKLDDVADIDVSSLIAGSSEPSAPAAEPTLEPVIESSAVEAEIPVAEPYLEPPIVEAETTPENFDDKSDPFFEESMSDTPLNLDDINLESLNDITVSLEPESSDTDIEMPSVDDFNLEDINSEIAAVLGDVEEPVTEPEMQVTESVAMPETPAAEIEEAALIADAEPEIVVPSADEEVAIIAEPVPAVEEIVEPVVEIAEEVENIPFVESIDQTEDINLGALEGFEETPNIFSQQAAGAEEVSLVNTEAAPIPGFIEENIGESIDSLLNNEILPPVTEVESLTPAAEMPAAPAVEVSPNNEETETVDVSASIINNFAKILSKTDDGNNNAEPEISTSYNEPAETSSYDFDAARIQENEERNFVLNLGEGNKTLSDIIHDVVRQIIGKEVARSWNLSLDYDDIVRQELRVWMDNNLPAMVEDLVKKEIRRVMVKVGDN